MVSCLLTVGDRREALRLQVLTPHLDATGHHSAGAPSAQQGEQRGGYDLR
jgi:hypothetical protein